MLRVIQTLTTPHAAYWFTETIDTAGRATPDAPVITDKFTQCGLYFVDSELKDARIQRLLVQYILGDPFIKALRATTVMARMSLQKEHNARWAAPRKPYGLEIPIPLETTLRNDSPKAPGLDIAPPYEALHMPTITPILPVDPREPWTGTISVTAGFGTFPLTYNATWVEEHNAPPHVQLSFPEQEHSATKGATTLTLKPQGAWQTTLRLPDGLPIASSGKMQFVIMGKYGSGRTAKLTNVQIQFKWNLIPVAYNNENVITQPWAASPL